MQQPRAAVIVAGGRSIRMGRSKAWLSIGGVPVLRRVVDMALVACPVVIVVGSPGQPLPPLPEGVRRVDDPPDRDHQGPLSGLLAGLVAADEAGGRFAYLGSCDAVYLCVEHIRFMLDMLAAAPNDRAIVPVTTTDDQTRVHGLSGAVQVTAALHAARDLLHHGRRSVHALYDTLGAQQLSASYLPDPRVLQTCNTPEAWHAAKATLERRGAP